MEQSDITVKIDGQTWTVPGGTLILDACESAGVSIPTLCHWPDVTPSASCGVCVVEVTGAKSLLRSCVTLCTPKMEISTASPRVMASRRLTLELLLASHPQECTLCLRNGTCELQALAERLGVRTQRFPDLKTPRPVDHSSLSLVRDERKCILCGRCVAVCREWQGVSAIDFAGRGARTRVAPFLDQGLASSVCTNCGQCSVVCPVGAIVEQDDTAAVQRVLADPKRTVVVQVAPAVRASLGEALGLPPGTLVTGKMVTLLRRLGFDRVFDTQFTADLTILEEGSELIHRMQNGGRLPLITSCSPGWIRFIETFYPSLLPHVSSCKSPQQMFGALAKTWYAQAQNIAPETMTVVSIMPCTAKKSEAARPEMDGAWAYWKRQGASTSSYPDVDFALTVRELARMTREVGIDISRLPEESFDDPLGESTGAAVVFGTTGGVMEAALRTVYELLNHRPLEKLEFSSLRGWEGIKTAQVDLAGTPVSVAVGHSLKNARILLDQLAAGESPYGFVEIMTCPGGCIGGGGQPVLSPQASKEQRQRAIYAEDAGKVVRKSHENAAVQALYEKFLGAPLGSLSHDLLHTHYHARPH